MINKKHDLDKKLS